MQINKPEPDSHVYSAHAAPINPKSDAVIEVADVVVRPFKSGDESGIDWETFEYVLNICMIRLLSVSDFFEPIINPTAQFSQPS